MRMIREIVTKLAAALATPRMSTYLCDGCDLRDHCSLPPDRRRLCWETRANRPR